MTQQDADIDQVGSGPVFFQDGKAIRLQRFPVDSPPYTEKQLQEHMREHPHLLPIEELASSFAPAITIGREVNTGAGPLDNLYISPGGGLTVVEAKLWKNPDARRVVVAQVLEYAHRLSKWNYSHLEQAAKRYLQKYENWDGSLHAWVTKRHPKAAANESDFVDNVERNLKQGRLLMLIVGAGIRENVEQLASLLGRRLFEMGIAC